MEKINVAELLKDCPKGMELDCVLCDGATFDSVCDENLYPIHIQTPEGDMKLSEYGCLSFNAHAKCIIFPKGKTTWEGFVPPCKFKDGDVVVDIMGDILIYKKIAAHGYCNSFVALDHHNQFILRHEAYFEGDMRLATTEEKEKLFKAIKENGYSWNAKTKTLEKLVEPKFKLGQNIRIKGESTTHIVTEVRENLYILDIKDISLPFENQDQWELVLNKFDITTLKPFDKVLVRDETRGKWMIDFFSHIRKDRHMFTCNTGSWGQCIPYEGNEHLLNTTDSCEDFYITW